MTFNEKYSVAENYQHLFEFSENDQIELDALWLAAQFLSPIQAKIEAHGISRKELAAQIGTSTGWLMQVLRGDKIPSFELIAKLQKALNLAFEVKLEQ